MKFKLEKTDKSVELIKLMGSKNRAEAYAAQEIFAEFVTPVIEEVMSQADTTVGVYQEVTIGENEPASLPYDLFEGDGEDTVRVWSQAIAGGLPSSLVTGQKELKFDTITLNSAVSFLKKYARAGRLDVVSKGLERMANEILFKRITNEWLVLLYAVAQANTNGLSHVIASTAAGRFQLDDLNRLLVRAKRINTAWTGGTPAGFLSRGVTDVFLSPERMSDVRAFAYQGMNTTATAGTIPLPDPVRDEIFKAAGSQSLFNVNIQELNEFGPGQAYNLLFDAAFAGSFNGATADLIVGVDRTRDFAFRPVIVGEGGAGLTIEADDQFVKRTQKIGFFTEIETGALVADARPLTAVTVAAA